MQINQLDLQQLEDFFHLSQAMFVVASLDGYFLQMNEAFLNTLGYSESELKEHPFIYFVHPDDITPTLNEVEKSRQGIHTLYFENRYRCKDGSYLWLAWSNTISENGYIHAVARDITDKKLIEEERLAYEKKLEEQVAEATAEVQQLNILLKKIINFAPIILWSVNQDGTFTLIEGNVLERMNQKPEHLIGSNIADLEFLHATEIVDHIQMAMNGKEHSAILQTENYAFDSHYFPIIDENGDVQAVAGVANDITDQMQIQAELKNVLDREVELGKLRSLFISMASHELRTPLTTILSSTELLENPIDRYPIEKRIKQYKRIKDAVRHMVQLLDDVLIIGKAQHGKTSFTLQKIQLCDLCCEIVNDLEDIGGTGHIINYEQIGECPQAFLDPQLMRQIITNLLSNAVKYSPEGGVVNFKLQVNEDSFMLTVQDQGIGIPEVNQAKLFTTFHRADNVGKIKGTGLGLAIVAQAVELHDGTINYQGKEGFGSIFTVTIPIRLSST